MVRQTMWMSLVDLLPRGNALAAADWQHRHRLLQWVLLAHVPALAVLGLALDRPPIVLAVALSIVVVCAVAGRLLRNHRRLASTAVTAGLVWCSTVLVGLTGGSIEAHFHFFIIIGFIALYQDWVPFLLNVLFTVVSHGVGSMWLRTLMFNHPAAQENPWQWSLVHGGAVLAGCVGVMIFWRVTEDAQGHRDQLTRELADAEVGRRQFTSEMLVNLARRNQSMLYRQLEIINELEESERNPDALAELFRLDHLTTRVRRNAENLLVLSGEKPPRVWSRPVALRDVVRAAIAETEDLDRVTFEVPEGPLVDGSAVTDLTHLLAELTENAVRFSPPDMLVTIRARRDPRGGRGYLLTVEDWGVGMSTEELAAANALLADPPEVDLSVSKRLGFHVVARLAARHGIQVQLSPTPGTGVTASVTLPGPLFGTEAEQTPARAGTGTGETARPRPRRAAPDRRPQPVVPHSPGPVQRPARRPGSSPTPEPERVEPAPEPQDAPAAEPQAAPATWRGWWADPPPEAADGSESARPDSVDGADSTDSTDSTAVDRPGSDLVGGLFDDHHGDSESDPEGDVDRAGTDGAVLHGAFLHDVLTQGPGTNGSGTSGANGSVANGSGPSDAVPDDGLDRVEPDRSESAEPTRGDRAGGPVHLGGLPKADVPGHDAPADEPAVIPAPRPAPAAERLTVPPPAPSRRPFPMPGASAGDAPSTLSRRVPQAHLAPELRRSAPRPDSVNPAPLPIAAEALVRYQANRRAAARALDDETQASDEETR
jgi:signal transduction histidine kinase